MSKSKNKRFGKGQFKPNPFTRSSFSKLPNMFANVPLADRIMVLGDLGRNAREQFQPHLEKLHSLIVDTNPLYLLSALSTYWLTSLAKIQPESTGREPLGQHHLELIQSIALKHNWDEYKMQRAEPIPIIQSSKKAVELFSQMRIANLPELSTKRERSDLALRESIRLHTSAVRNWGYPQHVKEILSELVEPLDQKTLAKHGIKASTCVQLLFTIVKLVELRSATFIEDQLAFFKLNSKPAVFAEYSRLFPFDPLLADSEQLLNDRSVSLRTFKEHLYVTSDFLLAIVHRFTSKDLFRLCASDDVTEDALEKLLQLWSLKFGDISLDDEWLFMGSPIRTKPFIALPDNNYVLPIPGLLISFASELIDQLFLDEPLKTEYEDRRADYLEKKIASLFRESFSPESVFAGVKWQSDLDKVVRENDVLLVLDQFAIVCEAKSGQVQESSRRGGDRLKSDVKRLMVNSALQASTFADFLSRNPGVHFFTTERGEKYQVDTTAVRHIIPVSVTLEDLALRWSWNELKEAGAVKNSIPNVPTLLLADLMVLLEILEDEAQLLHFFLRRSQLSGRLKFIGDEVDLLALHLKTRLLDVPANSTYLGVGDSTVFDRFFLNTFEGLQATKPKMPLTNRWEKMLDRIQHKRIPGWTALSSSLLNVSYSDQVQIDKRIERLSKSLKKKSNTEEGFFYSNNVNTPQEVLVVVVQKQCAQDEYRKTLGNAMQDALDATPGAKSVIGMLCDVKSTDLPYRLLAFIPSADEQIQVYIPD